MIESVFRLIGSRRFWIVVAMLVAATILHYPQQLPIVGGHDPKSFLGTERHAFERLAFLLPIVYAGLVFGLKGGLATLAVALIAMVPRDIWVSDYRVDASLETAGVVFVGGLVNVWLDVYRKERMRREGALSELRAAQDQLQFNLDVIRRRERELAAVNSVSALVSQSLESEDILARAARRARDVIGMEVFLAFLIEESTGDMVRGAYEGVSDAFASSVSRMAPGQGLNVAKVIDSEEPWVLDLDERDFVPMRPQVEGEGAGSAVRLRPQAPAVGTGRGAAAGGCGERGQYRLGECSPFPRAKAHGRRAADIGKGLSGVV
jgi:hypothetical protein